MSVIFKNLLIFSFIITLILVTGCKNGSTKSTNHAPVISAVTVSPPSVTANGSTTVTVTATDEDDDALDYSYAPTGGAIPGTGASVIWAAPGTAGAYSVIVTVSDGELEDTGSGTLTVIPASVVTKISGTASFTAGVNGDLNNSKVALYTSLANWNNYSPITFVAVSGSGAAVSYSITDVNPGNYYIDVWKDNDNDGVWSLGDFVGWYGSGGLGAPALTEFQISAGQSLTLNIDMIII